MELTRLNLVRQRPVGRTPSSAAGPLAGLCSRRGSTVVEFTLVGIPLIFTLISICEMARGMWLYHTLAYSIKEGTRFAIVHGAGCLPDPDLPPDQQNHCTVTVKDVARRVATTGIGLDPNEMGLELISRQGTVTCVKLNDCLSGDNPASGDTWPPVSVNGLPAGNAPGMDITLRASYTFRSAIAMFWPGAGKGIVFPRVTLPAASTETIQF